MNMLVDGEWQTDVGESTGESGEFQRQETVFRDFIRDDPDAKFQPEESRYHLYVSYACPWAHRTLMIRALKGLEEAITVNIVDPYRDDDGWQFNPEKEGCTTDTIKESEYLREVYLAADDDVTCRVSVPVLWDKQEETIVNNESAEILRMLDTEMDKFATRDVNLYPAGYQDEVDRVIDAIYNPINNGVYRAGFAGSQEAYDSAIDDLFKALSHWDSVLNDQRYLTGDHLSEADICMFTTLIRFDHVYHTHFKCNVQAIHEYDNLWPYLRDLYQTPGVAETVNFDHIKEHYYTTHPGVNPKRIVARGPDLDFESSHKRDTLPGEPPAALATLA